jgi:hypothetical protein
MPSLFAVGFGVSWLVNRALCSKALQQLEMAFHEEFYKEHLKDAFKFRSLEKVVLVARVARAWDLDGVPVPAKSAFAAFILKVSNALGLLEMGHQQSAILEQLHGRTLLHLPVLGLNSKRELFLYVRMYCLCKTKRRLHDNKSGSEGS